MHKFKSESGAVLVLVVAGMTAFLALLGLVIDLGQIYMEQVRLSRAVDAAVLAGVQELPAQPGHAVTTAYEYGQANNVPSERMLVKLGNANHLINVRAEKKVKLYLLSLFGYPDHTVAAEATAVVGTVASCKGVIPVGVPWQNFEFGQTVILKFDAHSGQNYQGNFGALALGGTGANNYRNNLKYGYQGVLRVGDQVYTEPGNMAGPTRDGLNYRLNQAGDGTGLKWYEHDARIAIVPVIDSLDVNGRDLVTVVGFAAFYLEDVEAKGNQATIKGRFIRHVIDGDIETGSDYGLLAYQLVK
ncbi:MAG TPA: hypothetical protein GX739_02920 [Firmicutes bacterium]|nr:hypothetical protein [Bacillota bacterium]